jgi:polysaccharide export outer membrane protein
MDLTMRREIQMTHRNLLILLVASAVLFLFADPAVAQLDLQQVQQQLSAPTSRSMSDAAVAKHSAGLTMVPEDFAQLRLAPGFLVRLQVLDDPDFAGEFRIDLQGDLTLPILGAVHVAGESAPEAMLQIRKRLLDGQILKDPQVDLDVLEYTAPEVIVMGEVASPGHYPLLVPRKLIDVLALAGGTTYLAGNEVQITEGKGDGGSVLVRYSKATDSKDVEQAIVHPGDTVQVKRAGIVYVLGAVLHPGGYIMQENGTLNALQAIALASGTTLPASIGTIYILRRNENGTEVDIGLPYSKIVQGKGPDVQLHAADILYVPTSRMKSTFINGQSLMASAASATIYGVMVH